MAKKGKQFLAASEKVEKGTHYSAADAVALVKEGYGDVSEYKAEIERLKDKCEELRNEKWDVQDDLDCYCDEMPNKIKQAQIDVLKKIKNCREATDSDCYPYLERIVNKLIEEVQNAEDKG